ncbi:glycogen debranching N-terminal domain-containing protein [Micromonospora sp. 4G57]|uniref:Glycogen debranching N-terminal domain-containing protein n=1 Tax=Micromonospora sicca TaxID=2202420 RepID=A0ABU5JJD6_9ACTN|nr:MULTISPECIES: glycogen debranching N-terminal domain-containing protein [unclassified Micromonospora]MDZ5445927.1 glycogen debranching N-terminal domain-containing protein [Micromonospora sp. 4G57]MDZ5492713.1 glycogen debranching N-terminal domain-containing protein [Micromonospora sp. 4G53]
MGRPISMLDGNTFLVSDDTGDIDASRKVPTGLFSYDTRFLSNWRLSINGERLHALSVDDVRYFETRFFLVPGEPTHYVDAKVSVIRNRTIGGSFTEDLAVLNHADHEVDLTVRLDMASDFADIFEIKNPQSKKATVSAIVEEKKLRLRYRRDRFHRETVISTSADAQIDSGGMTFRIRVPGQSEWQTQLRVQTLVLGAHERDFRDSLELRHVRNPDELDEQLREWMAAAPRLSCDSLDIVSTYRRSLADLAALRYSSITMAAELVAAGLPWFMTVFGRDSIFTCLQALPFTPQLTPTTLGTLAYGQGSRIDDFRDEEPGKILHELRYGESAGFAEQPHSPYYGAADSTPLFVILLDEYERWTGDDTLVRAYEFEARAALSWVDTYGDLLDTGYIWYQTRNPDTGLANQCWKDSWDSISYRDGRLPPFPRATCEQQGYAYDAKMRGARLARLYWNDPAFAERLEREAAELKDRFNREFWIADGEYYALALDADGGQVDALSSNIGHLLWSGIVDESRAGRIAELLLGDRLFSGWGVRTLATDCARYNPVGYHVGTVWPFDNSIIAWGLWRYGYRREAATICEAMFDAARHFQGRLPEAFAGYPRVRTRSPVQYPTACSPQAWSAGTPLLLLRVMLGLEPHDEHLIIDPEVPAGIGRVELLDIPGRWGKIDALGRSRTPDDDSEQATSRNGAGALTEGRRGA